MPNCIEQHCIQIQIYDRIIIRKHEKNRMFSRDKESLPIFFANSIQQVDFFDCFLLIFVDIVEYPYKN